MNPTSEKRLEKVHPELSKRIRDLIEAFAQRGTQVEVVQGLRTFAEQDALYAQGRTKPGARVTNARGGQSNHNYGLAVDLCPFVNGKPDFTANSTFVAIGTEAVKRGLEWGGNWKKFIDKPHVQLPGMTIAECSKLSKKGGLDAVWEEATRRLDKTVVKTKTTSTTQPPEHRVLGLKDKGSDVRFLQERLAAIGRLPQEGIDGIYGKQTADAIKAFQKEKGLTADGKVGPQTRTALFA
jgi:peptidoglycan L-alanyl-D-glutamate endopeptidase CwlK